MKNSALIFMLLALAACGKNNAQVSGQKFADCTTTTEQVDASMELLHTHKIDLLKLLRSKEHKDNKIAGMENLYSEVKSFNKANAEGCRDQDGTIRVSSMGVEIEKLLLEGIDDVKASKPVSTALISELDPGALERMSRAAALAQKIPEMLQKECGLELKLGTSTTQPQHTTIDPVSTKRIDDAVTLATNADTSKAETVTLWKLIESLNNVAFLISDEFIEEIGYANGTAEGWSEIGKYVKTLSSNLTEIMNHVEDYRKDPKKKPAVWSMVWSSTGTGSKS